jgi:uncharacterized membrane protein
MGILKRIYCQQLEILFLAGLGWAMLFFSPFSHFPLLFPRTTLFILLFLGILEFLQHRSRPKRREKKRKKARANNEVMHTYLWESYV